MTTPAFSRTFAFDAKTGLVKRAVAQAAITATAYVGTQFDQGAAVATDMVCVLNLEACKVSAGNEIYTFRLIGSNVADRSDGQILASMPLGHAGTVGIETRNALAGDQLHIYFRTEKNRTSFRYVDLHVTIAGTSPSITFNAYVTRSDC